MPVFNSYREDYTAEQFYREYYGSFAVIISIIILLWLFIKYWEYVVDWWRRLLGKNVYQPGMGLRKNIAWCLVCKKDRQFVLLREDEKMSMKFIVSKCTACNNEAVKRIEE